MKRSSIKDALEAQVLEEASRGTSCDRSRWKGIPGVRAKCGGHDPRGEALSDRVAEEVSFRPTAESGGVGNVCGSVRGGGSSACAGARGESRPGYLGACAGRRVTGTENGRPRREESQRGVVPDGAVASRAHTERSVSRTEVDLCPAGKPGRGANETGQWGTGLDAERRFGHTQSRQSRDFPGSSDRACEETGSRGTSLGLAKYHNHRSLERTDRRGRCGAQAFGTNRSYMPTTDVGSGSGARNGGAIRGGRRRRFSVLQRARARVIPGVDAWRAIERGSPTFDKHHEGRSAETALGADPSCVERLAAPAPRPDGHVGASRAGASRQDHRHRRARSQDGRNPFCYLAGRLRLRSETPNRGGRDGIASPVFGAPACPKLLKASRLSNIGCPKAVIALWWLRGTVQPMCRTHLAFSIATRRRTSTPAPLSANSRLRQLAVRPTERFPAPPAQRARRNRKTLPLTRSPLHSRHHSGLPPPSTSSRRTLSAAARPAGLIEIFFELRRPIGDTGDRNRRIETVEGGDVVPLWRGCRERGLADSRIVAAPVLDGKALGAPPGRIAITVIDRVAAPLAIVALPGHIGGRIAARGSARSAVRRGEDVDPNAGSWQRRGRRQRRKQSRMSGEVGQRQRRAGAADHHDVVRLRPLWPMPGPTDRRIVPAAELDEEVLAAGNV